MIGSMMLIAAARNMNRFSLRSVLDLIIKILIPILTAIILFWAIGGFSLGSGAEVHDLDEKGFNLLSFTNAYWRLSWTLLARSKKKNYRPAS
jgi:uncharacterized membrane protein